MFKTNIESTIVESLIGKTINKQKSKIPARLDLIQSVTGVILSVFIMFHLIFESSILLGEESMYRLTKFFEGEFIIEGGSPIFIIGLALVVGTIFVIHALLAMRKFPISYREYMRFRTYSKMMKHNDTNLWFIQVITGIMIFFLGAIHLYVVATQPENIGPYASSDRIYSDSMWIVYLMLLVTVVLHTGVGIYRLIMKWGFFDGKTPKKNRVVTKKIVTVVTFLYLFMGLLSLISYVKIGYEHQANYGERYHISTEGK